MFDLAASTAPAGGSPVGQVLLATGFAAVTTTALFLLVLAHRRGRTRVLRRLSAFAERVSGLPAWAAVPAAIAGPSLVLALTGLTWDVALHIENGRDEGPFANPSHYAILAGLYGIFTAGVLAVTLAEPGARPGPAAVRLAEGWHAPVGGLLMLLCASFALAGFPLDDLWHRLFGQDVTLWGPTHLMMLGGSALTLVGIAVILGEGMRARGARPAPGGPVSLVLSLRRVMLAGGLLLGISIFQYEFDFGVPQFRLLYHPLLVALAAGAGLVAARLWIGRGGALAAVGFYLVIRLAVSALISGGFGLTFQPFPLYVAEALVIEAVASRMDARGRPLAFGALAGLLAGAVSFAATYAWTQVAFPIPWTAALLPEGVVVALIAGTAGGVAGALLAAGLRGELPRPGAARPAIAAAGVAVAAMIGFGLPYSEPAVRAQVTLDGAGVATVRIDPPSAARDAEWLSALAYQGRGLQVDPLEEVAPGVWRSPRPLPLDGSWKTMIRLHRGDALMSVPLRIPADTAIPHPGVPAPAPTAERAFVFDRELLQLERRRDVPGGLFGAATAAVMALFALFLAALAAGVGRVARRDFAAPAARAEAPDAREAVPVG